MTAPAVAADADVFATGEVFCRIAARIPPVLPVGALDPSLTPRHGDHSLNVWKISPDFLATARVAAVLVGLVPREDGIRVLLTVRTNALREHAGQIAFPGGKVEADDASPAVAALREAREEIGLPPHRVEVLGYLEPYLTRTGFRIIPVVARIDPPFDLVLNPEEVVEAFETPFAFLMSEANHRLQHREWKGARRAFYSIADGERTIWGVTAGILRILYEKLYR